MKKPDSLHFLSLEKSNSVKLPLCTETVKAGFPSPADGYIESSLDLNEYLIQNPPATFFVKVEGHSMKDAGILDQDLLIIDRSKSPKHKQIVLAILNGEFTIKRLIFKEGKIYLWPENPQYRPILISSTDDFEVWGCVTYIIHKAI